MKTIFLIGTFFLLHEANAQRPLELPGGENSNFDPLKNNSLSIDETIQQGGEDTAFDPMKNNTSAIGQIMQTGGEDTAFDSLKNKTTAIDEFIQEGGKSTAYDEMKKEEQETRNPLIQEGGEDNVFDPLKNENADSNPILKTMITEEDIAVYPNPATDLLIVQSNGAQPEFVELYDMSGRMVLQLSGNSASNNSFRLDVGHLQRGWYTLLIRYNPVTITKKTVLF